MEKQERLAVNGFITTLVIISALLVGCAREPSSVDEARAYVIGRWGQSKIMGGRESPLGRHEETYNSDGTFSPGGEGGNTWTIVDLGDKPDSLGNKPLSRFAIQYAGGRLMYLVSRTKARNGAGNIMLYKK